MSCAQGRVLITGAGGFVGACLARRLVEVGREVYCLLRDPSPPWRLAGLAGKYIHLAADVRDGPAVCSAVRASRPEIIFHLAAHGAYPAQRDRTAILTTNVLGTANLLDAAGDLGYHAFVHTGSSSEYGHKAAPLRPGDLLEPRTDYAVAKAAATLLCQAEARQGRPVTTVRIFTAYGPWDDPGRLVLSAMACCRRGEAPRVTRGDQPRDFVYIDDVLDLLLTAAKCPAAFGRILHAGSGRPQTVRQMADTIALVCTDGRLRPNFGAIPGRSDEPCCWVADIAETTALTGWRPRVDLRTGVERTWRWYQTIGAPALAG